MCRDQKIAFWIWFLPSSLWRQCLCCFFCTVHSRLDLRWINHVGENPLPQVWHHVSSWLHAEGSTLSSGRLFSSDDSINLGEGRSVLLALLLLLQCPVCMPNKPCKEKGLTDITTFFFYHIQYVTLSSRHTLCIARSCDYPQGTFARLGRPLFPSQKGHMGERRQWGREREEEKVGVSGGMSLHDIFLQWCSCS